MLLSVQLYTVRDALAADLAGTLAKLKSFGLDYVELAGLGDHTVDEWKALLDENGLKVSAAHVGLDRFQNEFDAVVNEAKTLGYNYVVLPWVGSDVYADGWDKFAQSLIPYAERLKAEGLTMGYHNHAFEFENDGLDTFYAAVDADLLKAQLDLAWVKIGGADPAAYIEKYAGRLPLVHLKDFDPDKTPQWQPAGTGTMDFDAILAACAAAGVEFGSVELDESPGDPLDAVRESVAYFKSKGLQ